MKPLYTLLLVLLFASCAKDKPAAVTVDLDASCFRCAVEYSHKGTVHRDTIGLALPADTMPQPVGRLAYAFTALAGDEVALTMTALSPSDTRTLTISARVDGHVQGFQYLMPTGADSLGTVTIQMTVPELDKWGEPK